MSQNRERYYVETECDYDDMPLAEDHPNRRQVEDGVFAVAYVRARVVNLITGAVGEGALSGIICDSLGDEYLSDCMDQVMAEAKHAACV